VSGQELLVGVALVGAVSYLIVQSRRAHTRAKVQSGVCSRCKATRADADRPEVRVSGPIGPQ